MRTTTSRIRSITRQASAGLMALALALLPLLPATNADALQITSRRITLQAGTTDGGSKPGGVVNHFFEFTLPSTANVGSMKFQYCELAAGACVVPAGLSTTGGGVTLGSQSGATGFTLNNTVNGEPYITRSSASITGGTAVSYQLAGVTNPTTAPDRNETFFVRISTYVSSDTTGGYTDLGTVTASTNEQILINGTMPESLVFCTGATITKTGGVPDCSTATLGVIEFNQLFSPTDTATAMSKMAASTNAGFGYSITVNGLTLMSGANEITANATSKPITRGAGEFGLNLVLNTTATSTVAVGAAIDMPSNGTSLKAAPTTDYGTVDNFKFVSGDVIAQSNQGGAGGTDAQIMTISYIANVPGNQPAGTYSTTLTYICTPTF